MKLCNLDTAKALQALGYDGEYNQYVSDDGSYLSRGSLSAYDWHIPCPRLDDAAYWIREKFGLLIYITHMPCGRQYLYHLSDMQGYYDLSDRWADWKPTRAYDSALEAAVAEAIEIIKTETL